MKSKGEKNSVDLSAVTDRWRQQAVSRSNCYGLLAIVFRSPPSIDVVEKLRAPSLAKALSHLGYDVTQDLAGELEAVTKHLAEQYTRIFAGPGPHVSLYASVHHDQESGQLWGPSTAWVKRFIENTGLSFNGNWDSIPDHIAIELELMQRLTAYEAQLWASSLSAHSDNKQSVNKRLCQCLRTQEQFLREHIGRWAHRFCECVLETQNGLFYQKMARLTSLLVLSDGQKVGDLRFVICNRQSKIQT